MGRQIAKQNLTQEDATIATLQAQISSLICDNERLSSDNARLVKEAEESAHIIEELSAKMERLIEQIKLANMRFFGSKSERVIPEQLSLFNSVEAASSVSVSEPKLSKVLNPPKPRRRGGKRKIDTSTLERIVIEHVIEEPICPSCGHALDEMKVEVTEVVRLVPAHLVVEEHRRHVYKCTPCCKANAQGDEVSSQILRAPMPALTPIPHSFATPSLIASVLNSKYAYSMPLYRLEEEFRELGVDIARQTMANWVINVHARWLSRVHARMKEHLLAGRYINADETEVQVLKEPNRTPKQKSRMWLFRSGPHDIPNCIFEYHESRSGKVAKEFLEGFSGYLTTDGYEPYFNLGLPSITNTACLVHIRRRFAEIVKVAGGDGAAASTGSVALEARRRIDEIFRIDAKFDKLSADERKSIREEKLSPLMGEFKIWAGEQITHAIPRLALYEALAYALKLWPYVENVLLDGNLALDNNIAERTIKPFVIGRKNWLFSDTPRGAAASAAIYSIVVTAKLNGLNQRAYLEWVLTEMPNDAALDEPGRIDYYLPWSDDVPDFCRLNPAKAKQAKELADKPIVDKKLLKALEEIA